VSTAADVHAAPPAAAGALLPMPTKLWYTLGQLGEGIKNESFSYFLLFYYTNVLDLSGTLAGLAYLISMVVDAVADPMMGVLTDRTRSRLGRRHPWIFASALPLALSLYLVFAPPAGLSQGWLFAWMLVWTLVNRFALTMFHVPYLALGAELTRDWHERTVLVSMRHSFGQLALFAPAVLGFMWLFRDSAEHGQGRFYAPAYPVYAAICGVAVFMLVLASAWKTRDRIPHLAQPDTLGDGRNALSATWHDLLDLLRQRSFRAVFFGLAIASVASGVTLNLGLHAASFFWDISSGVLAAWRIVVALAILAGLAFWTRRARTHDKGVLFSEGLIWYVVIHTAVWLAATYGFWPDRSHAWYVPFYLIGTGFLAPFAVASTFAMGQSMMADCADQDECDTGRRREGVFFGAASLAMKVTLGGGALLAGLISDFVGMTGLHSIADVTPQMREHIGIAMTLSVLALMGLSLLVFRQYDLSRARLADIHARLEARRSAAGG
jgi:GPH family glycoside/pentoside/hexuronide:cation symporter